MATFTGSAATGAPAARAAAKRPNAVAKTARMVSFMIVFPPRVGQPRLASAAADHRSGAPAWSSPRGPSPERQGRVQAAESEGVEEHDLGGDGPGDAQDQVEVAL